MSLDCPHCHCENTQRVTLLACHVVEGSDGVLLSTKHAPPKNRERLMRWGAIVGISVLVLALYGKLLWAVSAGLAVGGWFYWAKNRKAYWQGVTEWSRQFACLQCQQAFIPDSPLAAPAIAAVTAASMTTGAAITAAGTAAVTAPDHVALPQCPACQSANTQGLNQLGDRITEDRDGRLHIRPGKQYGLNASLVIICFGLGIGTFYIFDSMAGYITAGSLMAAGLLVGLVGKKLQQRRQAAWAGKFICLRCEQVFMPATSATISEKP